MSTIHNEENIEERASCYNYVDRNYEYCDVTLDEYFTFTLLFDDTYSVKSKNVNNMPNKVVIPSLYNGQSVTFIENSAFQNCSHLTSITIPDSVTYIGNRAFQNCHHLTSITIPDSVKDIGENAFCHCSSLTSITVDENNRYYKSIDGNLYCKNGRTLIQYAIGKKDASFEIPDSVTSIGEDAFSW